MKVFTLLTFGFTCLIALNPAYAADKVYKWTDSKGNTHYAQRPPANTETEIIKPQTGHSEPVTYTSASSETNVKKAETKEKPLKDPERCESARKNLETLKTYSRIKIKGDDGEFRYLTADEQKQKTDEATKAIEESCD